MTDPHHPPTGVDSDLGAMLDSALRGAAAGAVAAARLDLLDDLLAAQYTLPAGERAGHRGARRGPAADGGATSLMLRGIPFGLLTPLDRPRLRSATYHSVTAAGGDDLLAITAVAVAVISADLARRFAIGEAEFRCRQTLLEEAPAAVLGALNPHGDLSLLGSDSGALAALRIALTALHRGEGVDDVVDRSAGDDRAVSVVLAGAWAGIRARSAGNRPIPEDVIPRLATAVEHMLSGSPVPAASANGSHG